jgi:hypothetical protein
MKRLSIVAFAFFIVLIIQACRKKNDIGDSIRSAQDNASVETEFGNIYDVASGFAQEDTRTGKTDADKILPSGAIVSFQDSLFFSQDGSPVLFTIDYGDLKTTAPKGLLCKDGRYRAGKIHISLKEKFGTADNQMIITISDADKYYVGNGTNMYQLTGTITTTRQGSLKKWSTVVNNATLQTERGLISWNASRTIEQTVDVSGALGDEYTVTGSAQGTNSEGETFVANITTPLVKRLQTGCLSTFVSGVWTLSNAKGDVFSVDYDPYNNAACDKTIKVKYNNRERIISVW